MRGGAIKGFQGRKTVVLRTGCPLAGACKEKRKRREPARGKGKRHYHLDREGVGHFEENWQRVDCPARESHRRGRT